MYFPSLEEVESADRYQICKWNRFLPSAETKDHQAIQSRIWSRFQEVGGFTPEISKSIGWEV